MDESTTRRKKIDPALYQVGWESVPGSEILNEQRAYLIAPGRVEKAKENRHPKKVDYILEYKGIKLAVIEAKSDEIDVTIGIKQAKQYAEMLQIRYAYSTNGDEIYFIDMGLRDEVGEYLIPSTEGYVDHFPSPQELWQMTFPVKDEWRDKFNLEPFNRGGGREPRYYQVNAINNVLNAVAKERRRILLTMATGTGKTYVAFQICWKLYETNWNKSPTVISSLTKPLTTLSSSMRMLWCVSRPIISTRNKRKYLPSGIYTLQSSKPLCLKMSPDSPTTNNIPLISSTSSSSTSVTVVVLTTKVSGGS